MLGAFHSNSQNLLQGQQINVVNIFHQRNSDYNRFEIDNMISQVWQSVSLSLVGKFLPQSKSNRMNNKTTSINLWPRVFCSWLRMIRPVRIRTLVSGITLI